MDIQAALRELPGWVRDGEVIRKQFVVTINYRRVTIEYTTHSEGRVTDKDVAGARMADACA